MTQTIGILIGGASRRMGRPKALLDVGGTTLIERTIAAARSVCDDVVLLGRPPFDLPPDAASLPVLPDRHAGFGPLAGLESLLSFRPGVSGVLIACDMPNLPAELLQQLCRAAPDCDAAVCRTNDAGPRWHPCCAVYHAAALPAVQAAVASRRLAMTDLVAALKTCPLDLSVDEAHWVANWNEPMDLARS